MARQRLSRSKVCYQSDFSVEYCWENFLISQQEKGNSKYTIRFYDENCTKSRALTLFLRYQISKFLANIPQNSAVSS